MTDTTGPRECKFCGHIYVKPCDGEDPACGNRPHAEAAKESAKLSKEPDPAK